MDKIIEILEKWRKSTSLKSSIEKNYEIDGNEVTLTLLVSFGDDPTKDKSFIRTCKADVSSVIRAKNELEEEKASSLSPRSGHIQ